ncbi:MAG TPA: M48 family metalloprotease [Casimicrobiaceae bacterium]|nr:M48 family metalloprotease [Casimicrobiaceae bacterium]
MRVVPRRSRRVVAAVTAFVLAATPIVPAAPVAAQALPDLGDVSQVNFSLVQERKLGEAIMRQARASGGVLNDPEVNDYLNELGSRLVAVSPDARQDFEFFAVPDSGINAFALPGGFIGVNTGLVLLAQSESELASVIAHEITHVTQRHIARLLQGQQNSMLMSLAALAVALLAARAGGSSSGDAAQAAVATSQALALQSQLNFTREFEFEADRIGFQRLAAAGFDVRGAAQFMERLQRSSRFLEGTAPSYLRTHPVTYERIAEAASRAESVPYRQIPDSLDFHMVRALLRSYQGEPEDAVRFFRDALAERKFNEEVAVRYGLVAAYLRAKDYPRAKQALATLEKDAPQHPMIEAIAGHVLLESGDVDAAIRRLQAALQRYPNKMQLVYDYPDALMKAKRHADAAAFCEEQLQRFPGNGTLHRLAARAYAGLDRKLKQHYHQGEYYAWLGNLKLAIDQLQLASRSGDANFYESSVVEVRLRALRREIAEQQKEGFGRQG